MTFSADVLAHTEALLASRPSRAPDHEMENRALLTLAVEMADRPESVLNRLCDLVLDICGADSAGVSLLGVEGAGDDFVWPAISGAWSPYMGGGMPRDASPCGVVVARDAPLIFHDVVAQFPAAAAAQPPIAEILLAPFHHQGEPIGTVWAIAHNSERQFDQEDRRLLLSIAKFASAAYQTTQSDKAARDAEAVVQLANRELGHRIKNMLTIVQAISSQTFRHSSEPELPAAFNRRLGALADAQDLLIQTSHDAALISDILSSVLGAISVSSRVRIEGPPVMLGPRAALAMALAVHELGTNAVKYGALSNATGEILAIWTADPEGALTFTWRETGGPEVAAPSKKGFGTKLIALGLLGDGGVAFDYAPTGLTVRFKAPLDRAQTE